MHVLLVSIFVDIFTMQALQYCYRKCGVSNFVAYTVTPNTNTVFMFVSLEFANTFWSRLSCERFNFVVYSSANVVWQLIDFLLYRS